MMKVSSVILLTTALISLLTATATFAGTPLPVLTGNPTNMGQSPLETKNFGDTTIGNTVNGGTETVTVEINGETGVLVDITNINATGDFSVAGGTCVGATGLGQGDTCTLDLDFTPSATGVRNGVLNVTCQVTAAAIGVIGLVCDDTSHVAYNLSGSGILGAIISAIPLLGKEGLTILAVLLLAASMFALWRRRDRA